MNRLGLLLGELADRCSVHQRSGFAETPLHGVHVFRVTEPAPRVPLLYSSGIVIIGQGAKVGHLGGRSYRYDADHYLVLTVPVPMECEIFASARTPLLGLFIDLDLSRLYELVSAISTSESREHFNASAAPTGIASVAMDDEMRDATERLLTCFRKPLDTRVLGPSLVNEITYRVLLGDHGHALYALTQHNGQYARVVRALHMIHQNYATSLTIETLAREAAMSPSAFHRVFKQVTSDSPLQYLKKIRLNKARDLIVHHDERSSVAAARVGYESASQFTREFRRYFGETPTQARESIDPAPDSAHSASAPGST